MAFHYECLCARLDSEKCKLSGTELLWSTTRKPADKTLEITDEEVGKYCFLRCIF